MKKLSDKRLKALGGKVPFSTIRKKKRPASKTIRIYGSKARRDWVKLQPCAACGVVGYSENAHVAPPSEKGTGYKADAKWVAPLCGMRELWSPGGFSASIGCHTMYDEFRSSFDRRFPDFDPAKACAETERAWLLEESA